MDADKENATHSREPALMHATLRVPFAALGSQSPRRQMVTNAGSLIPAAGGSARQRAGLGKVQVSHSPNQQGSVRRGSISSALSPRRAKHIVLRALGPSPSQEALRTFVDGLSKDERKLFFGDRRNVTPRMFRSPELLVESPHFTTELDVLLGRNNAQAEYSVHSAKSPDSGSDLEGSLDECSGEAESAGPEHFTEFTARGATPSAKKKIGRCSSLANSRAPLSVLPLRLGGHSPFRTPMNSARSHFGGTQALWETRAQLAEQGRERDMAVEHEIRSKQPSKCDKARISTICRGWNGKHDILQAEDDESARSADQEESRIHRGGATGGNSRSTAEQALGTPAPNIAVQGHFTPVAVGNPIQDLKDDSSKMQVRGFLTTEHGSRYSRLAKMLQAEDDCGGQGQKKLQLEIEDLDHQDKPYGWKRAARAMETKMEMAPMVKIARGKDQGATVHVAPCLSCDPQVSGTALENAAANAAAGALSSAFHDLIAQEVACSMEGNRDFSRCDMNVSSESSSDECPTPSELPQAASTSPTVVPPPQIAPQVPESSSLPVSTQMSPPLAPQGQLTEIEEVWSCNNIESESNTVLMEHDYEPFDSRKVAVTADWNEPASSPNTCVSSTHQIYPSSAANDIACCGDQGFGNTAAGSAVVVKAPRGSAYSPLTHSLHPRLACDISSRHAGGWGRKDHRRGGHEKREGGSQQLSEDFFQWALFTLWH